MRAVKGLILLIPLLFSVACNGVVLPVRSEPTASPTVIPTSTFRFPTLTPAPTPVPPTATAVQVPGWIADFSDPILKATSERRPDYQDEFSPYNQGWFIPNPANSRRPFFANVQEGALFLELPEGGTRKGLTVYSPKLLFKDFVLSFDFKFGKTEPDDILRFEFYQTPEKRVALDLSKNESWTFYWKFYSDLQSSSGAYDYFSPEYLNVTIIMQGNECAVYLNHDPVNYFGDCRTLPIGRPTPLTMTLHLLGTGRPALVQIDHVKVWDLEKIPGLP